MYFSSTTKLSDLEPSTVVLAVEITDTGLRYDMGRKAMIYAANGARELWTNNMETLQTHIFTKPSAESYLERGLIEPNEMLAPNFAPQVQ